MFMIEEKELKFATVCYSNSEGVNIFSESARFCFLNGKTNYVIGEKVHSFSEGELYEATLPLE